jgi:AcrR family transcriptional regulator
MVARDGFPISELVNRTGVPAATVHHYLRLGLLPRPERLGRNRFLYGERHVRSLALIRLLRDRRARLLAAAMDAFAKRGFADVNVDDICRAARIAKGSFYRHFRSKEELFFAAADAAREEVTDAFGRAVASVSGPAAPAEALAVALEPRLALFVELLTRAIRRQPGYAAEARRVFSRLAYEVGEHLGAEDPISGGAWLLGLAAAGAFRRALQPSPLAAVEFPGLAPA